MKSVLITGGSGFFGRGFARAALAQDFERICIYSRGEYAQHLMRQEFGNDDRLRFFIGDVRDVDRLTRAMDGVELVVHGAALKRVEVGEYNATEMYQTNCGGAINVIQAARAAGVKKIVALSTDKACEPINCYGASKLLAEKLFLCENNARGSEGPIIAVCRYGNVSGSTGSVIPTWRAAQARGEIVQLTDPDCTRYWMTLDQAVSLVMETAENMVGGELVIPDLPAYRLSDLADALGVMHSVIGLGAGEKIDESMRPGETSAMAQRMGVQELKEALKNV